MSQTVVKLEMLIPKAGYSFLQEFAKEHKMAVSDAAAVLLQSGYEFYMEQLKAVNAELAEARRAQQVAEQYASTQQGTEVPASVANAVAALDLSLGRKE